MRLFLVSAGLFLCILFKPDDTLGQELPVGVPDAPKGTLPAHVDVARLSVDDSEKSSTWNGQNIRVNQIALVNDGATVPNDVASSTCTQTESCDVCNSFHTCHWCEHDNACHAIGSYYGCSFGASCTKKKASNETDPSGCQAHTSCNDCSLSHVCHWCAHDNACHVIGSVYGCATGVDCYDNTHCKRDKPEPLPHVVVPTIGLLPLIVIGVLTALVLCCTTCCYCIMGGIKSAYDDLLDISSPPPPPPDAYDYELLDDAEPVTPTRRREKRTKPNVSFQEADVVVEPDTIEPESLDEPDIPVDSEDVDAERQLDAEPVEATVDPLATDEADAARRPLVPTTLARRRPRPRRRAMNGMYNACFCCYGMTVACVAVMAVSAVYFFPKKPIYSICNDAVAWKSLIDSMTGMKAKAEFEILASIYNPNHLDVALDMGKGSFSHDGAFVGTYEIPPVLVEGTSVTDILIVAAFTPEKWDALSIATEYYRGTLVLSVDAQASIRIPALADYTFPFALTDLVVHVNEMSDRHLCACPTWSDAKNKTPPVLTLPFTTASN